MKTKLSAAIAFSILAASAAAFAQTATQTPGNPSGASQSPRCDALSSDAREQCLRDENAKTENKTDDAASKGSSTVPSDAKNTDVETPPNAYDKKDAGKTGDASTNEGASADGKSR